MTISEINKGASGVISSSGITASSTDTLTNKTIDANNNTISNLEIGNEVSGTIPAGKQLIIPSSSDLILKNASAYNSRIRPSASTDNIDFTFPTVSSADTLVTITSTAALSNKSIVGVTTNSNAAAGSVGEYISSSVLVASKVSLTSTVGANVTSISLTAGDWDICGNVVFEAAATTLINTAFSGINATSATIPAAGGENDVGGIYSTGAGTLGAGVSPVVSVGSTRKSLASTTTIYLVASATFTTSTCAAYGFIGARRVR